MSSETGRRFGCPSCGGGLQYDIESGKMKCDRCGSLTALSEIPDGTEDAGRDGTMEVTEFHCPQCGAVVYSTDTSVTSWCSFCGSDVVLAGRLGRTRRPGKIVPFHVTREGCEKAYREHLGHFRMTPAALKAEETISHFRPVYVPFWSYRVESEGVPELKGTRSYSDSRYRYSEEYDLTMDAEIRQEGILYDASSAFEDETAALLKYTGKEAVPFHAAYLSGFYAQAADVAPETYHEEAAATTVRMFMEQVKEQFKMDTIEMAGEIDRDFGLPNARIGEEMIMMPVWLLAQRQGARVVYTAVNGVDGQVVCDVPVAQGKAAAAAGVLAVIFFLLLFFLTTLKPDVLMLICGILAVVIQYLFTGAREALQRRKERAFEPDFRGGAKENAMTSGGAGFVGPAQALLKNKGKTISVGGKGALGKLKSWIWVGVMVIIFLAYGLLESGASVSRLLSSLGSGTGDVILAIGMAVVTMLMVIHLIRKAGKGDGISMIPRLLACGSAAAGLILLIRGTAEDMAYYLATAGMLGAAIWELVMINRAHNEYASRPVPFFGEKEEAR